MDKMRRYAVKRSLSLNTAVSTTPEIDYEHFSGGTIYIPDGSSITTLTWHVAPEKGGTYLAAQDSSGDAVTQTVAADEAHPIPEALFGARAIKAVVNAAGDVEVSLKG